MIRLIEIPLPTRINSEEITIINRRLNVSKSKLFLSAFYKIQMNFTDQKKV